MNRDWRLSAGRIMRLVDLRVSYLVQVSPFGGNPRWQLAGLFVKGDDDLRQERNLLFVTLLNCLIYWKATITCVRSARHTSNEVVLTHTTSALHLGGFILSGDVLHASDLDDPAHLPQGEARYPRRQHTAILHTGGPLPSAHTSPPSGQVGDGTTFLKLFYSCAVHRRRRGRRACSRRSPTASRLTRSSLLSSSLSLPLATVLLVLGVADGVSILNS